jgi:hypothetical protein
MNCKDDLIGSVGFAGVTAIDFNVAAAAVNVAVTVSAVAGIVNEQVAPARAHIVGAPFHPANVEPPVIICVSTTCVPAARLTMQPLAEPLTQLIPLPVTVPLPVPMACTVNCTVATAVTLIGADEPVIDDVSASVAVIV